MVISVILIQHFPGILCVTEFQATQIFRKTYFLATWASQYHYQQIPGIFMVKILQPKFTENLIPYQCAYW